MYQEITKNLPEKTGIQMHQGFPLDIINNDQIFERTPDDIDHVVVLDDIQDRLRNHNVASFVKRLVTILMHHCRLTVFIVLHDCYSATNETLQIIRRNAQYILCFRGISNQILINIQKEKFTGYGGLLTKVANYVFETLHKQYFLIDVRASISYRLKYGVLSTNEEHLLFYIE